MKGSSLNMKKLWILFLAIAAIFIITACGDVPGDDVPYSPGSSSQNGESPSGNGTNPGTPGNGDSNGNNGDNNGSGSDQYNNGDPDTQSVFYFKFRDVVIDLDEDIDIVISKLGEPRGDFRGPSCAFEGLEDRIIEYNGVQFQGYPDGELFRVFLIAFIEDDSARTPEGRISIGSSIQAVLDAYGDDYEYDTGSYKFTRGLTSLLFITDGDNVLGVQYRLDLGL
jgi:hypothetical protein